MRPPRGIETCGILAGHEDLHGGGGYTVTHLVIPSQRAGADFCEMLNEDQLLEFCLREGLITLGWVHVSVCVPQIACDLVFFLLHGCTVTAAVYCCPAHVVPSPL